MIPDNLVARVACLSVAGIGLMFSPQMAAATSQVVFIWSGAVTDSSAVVKAKLTDDSLVARLAVSADSTFATPMYSPFDTSLPENARIVTFPIAGLEPGIRYYYAPEVNGVLDVESVGRLRAFPADSTRFMFAFASCAQTASNHAVFQTIRSLDPLFFFHLGDFHYLNIAANDRDVFRGGYDTVLSSPGQAQLYREYPIEYIWDDHDFGPNNSDSTAPGREASRLTYQEYVPHYPLAEGAGNVAIYHAFTVGHVRFIVCDSRSARSPASAPDDAAKTMLGAAQKAWFKQELLDAKSNYALIVWVNTLPWIGATGDDGWYIYTNERRELADFIEQNGITNICMISGDAHMLAIDDGSNNNYATGGGARFRVMHAAALDRAGSVKGGPYSEGTYPGPGQFGLMTIRETADSIYVGWSGRNHLNQVLVSCWTAFPLLPGE